MKKVDYLLFDQKVCSLNNSIETDVLRYVHPQNIEEEKTKFFKNFNEGIEYNPQFTYLSRNPIYSYFTISPKFETLKKDISFLLESVPEDALGLIFEKKLIDLYEKMELIRSAGTPNFSDNSINYFGNVDSSLINYAKKIVKEDVLKEKNTYTFSQAKKFLEKELKKRKLKHKIIEKNTPGVRYSIYPAKREIMISNNTKFSKNTLQRMLFHEVEAHAFRYENGLNQNYKIFSKGISKETLETEEGIAANIEELSGINSSLQMKIYAGRVLAINKALNSTFFETFSYLKRFFDDEEAFTLTLRAKRGLFHTRHKGAFTKDLLYLRGYLDVKDFLKNHSMEELYYGKFATYDYSLIKDIDGLKKPKYLPTYLKK